MATTRAEALSNYARVNRVTDVTLIPFDRHASDSDATDTFLHDAAAFGGAGLRGLIQHGPRSLILLAATIAMTPVLPALLG